MNKNVLFLGLILLNTITAFCQSENANLQESERKKLMDASMKTEDKLGWTRKVGLGLDIGQLLNLNPYVGGGSNRLGLGGALAFKTIYKKGMIGWTNDFGLNFSAQRIGNGVISTNSKEKIPFEKALDILNFSSNFSYKINSNSAWSFAADLFLISQFTSSYKDSLSNKIYLKSIHSASYNTNLVSKFFSPANIIFALGMKYQKVANWYFFISPIASKSIIITDQNIANLGVHGTKKKENSSQFSKSSTGLGSLARAGYSSKIYNRLNFNSELLLYSDYLDNPQNIDVTWFNTIGVELFKGLNLMLKIDAFYDDNKTNSITDFKAVGGINGTGKRLNLIQQFILAYNRNF